VALLQPGARDKGQICCQLHISASLPSCDAPGVRPRPERTEECEIRRSV